MKRLFNLLGIAVVSVWVVMIGLLIKKLHFTEGDMSVASKQVAGTIDSPQREWKEIYLKDKKVGYTVSLVKPFDGGYLVQEEVFLRLNLMGLASGVYTATQCRVDDNFLLKSFNFSMSSGVVRFNLTGRVLGDELLLESARGKAKRTQRIKLSAPPMMGACMGFFLKSRKIRVGEEFKVPIFDPSTTAQKEAIVKVVAREPITINRIRYNAYRLETEMWGKLLTSWVDESGTTLKEKGFMGFTIVKSSAAVAPLDIEGQEEVDFYDAASISVERRLPEPSRVHYLKLQVDGINNAVLDPDVLTGGRQRFHEGVMEISREYLPSRAPYSVPYPYRGDGMKPFLKSEFNIESDEKEIIEKAREIFGSEKDPLVVSRRLFAWVYDNLEKRPVVSVPSALEVLKTRVGDCNEHATLLTALLRASGIPARLNIGLVYNRGKFFYHAWTEAYVGKWVSMDATLNQMPVDATHIKLVEGNLERQVEIAGLIGQLKLKVLDYRYD
ncbi:MAG: transglutaminase domain-containing protein [Desulfobacteraceae bacterium]